MNGATGLLSDLDLPNNPPILLEFRDGLSEVIDVSSRFPSNTAATSPAHANGDGLHQHIPPARGRTVAPRRPSRRRAPNRRATRDPDRHPCLLAPPPAANARGDRHLRRR